MPGSIHEAGKRKKAPRGLIPADPEIGELPPVLFPGDSDSFDIGQRGPQLEPGDQPFDTVLFPFSQDFHPPIPEVSDPPGQAEGGSPSPGVITKKNTLHPARHKDPSSGFHLLFRYVNIVREVEQTAR